MILSVSVYDWWTTAINTPGVKTILVFILLSAVEVSPVKINPWSWLGGLVGKMLGVKDKLLYGATNDNWTIRNNEC